MHAVHPSPSALQKLSPDEIVNIFSFHPHPTLKRVCQLWNNIFPQIAFHLLPQQDPQQQQRIETYYYNHLERPSKTLMTKAVEMPSWELQTLCVRAPLDLTQAYALLYEVESQNIVTFFYDAIAPLVHPHVGIDPKSAIYEQALKITTWLYRNTFFNTIPFLKVNSCYLTAFPQELSLFSGLKSLVISCPNLQGLPAFLGKAHFPHLDDLHIENAGLMRSIPAELHTLPIKISILKGDWLETIPHEIWNSAHVKALYIRQCPRFRWSAEKIYLFLSKPGRTCKGAPDFIMSEVNTIRIEVSRRALDRRTKELTKRKEQLNRLLTNASRQRTYILREIQTLESMIRGYNFPFPWRAEHIEATTRSELDVIDQKIRNIHRLSLEERVGKPLQRAQSQL